MPDETLLTMANEIRGKTLRLLDGVPEDAARFTAGLSNSILWHAGHALMLAEHLCLMPATAAKEPQYPRGWYDLFAWGSRPALAPPDAWPRLADVTSHLREQIERLRSAIRGLSPQDLDRVHDPARDRTVRYSIVHGLHDEATHQGEIHLLKKLYGRQTASATSTGS